MRLPFITGNLRAKLRRQALTRSGILARRLLYPNPRRAPANQPVIHVSRDAGIGDVLMCTPALRELKRLNPLARICFYTNFENLVRGLPYIDEVRPFADRPDGCMFLEYTHLMPSPVHIARLFGDKLGVDVRDPHPDCMIDRELVARYLESWAELPRPRIVALRRASRFTPNKDWPDESWTQLLSDLCGSGTVIEIGVSDEADRPLPFDAYRDLRGKTSIVELAAAVAAADIYVGPVSGPLHIAAAANVPAVAVIGGFEHPVNAHYAGNIEFYTRLPCSPCWLLTPCPYDIKCLRAIFPPQVAQAVRTLWAEQPCAARSSALSEALAPCSDD